jgi:phosphoglycerate kinase
MENTFLKAEGLSVGSSKIEEDMVGTAAGILSSAEKKSCGIGLPSDVVVAEKMEPAAETQVVEIRAIPSMQMALDIGPKTVTEFEKAIRSAGTIVWNGPMGVFEMEPFKKGTMDIAQAVASASAFSLVGGGDTIRAVQQAGVADKISYISTGGGAFMEFMEGKTLPGVAALES